MWIPPILFGKNACMSSMDDEAQRVSNRCGPEFERVWRIPRCVLYLGEVWQVGEERGRGEVVVLVDTKNELCWSC